VLEIREGDGEVSEEDAPAVVTTSRFARLHGVSIFTVWRWIREGKVSAEKCPGGYRWRVNLKISTEQTLANPSEGE
jgi:hypothetical protein